MTRFITTTFTFIIAVTASGQNNLIGIGPNFNNGYDFRNKSVTSGVALNGFVGIFNFGFDYRHSFDNNPKTNEFMIFGGLGYRNIIQLQYGKSTINSAIIRLRTDWNLDELGRSKPERHVGDNVFTDFINVSVFADKFVDSGYHDWIFGVGIGYNIRMTGHGLF